MHGRTLDEEPPKVALTRRNLAEAMGLIRYLRPYRLKFALAITSLFIGSLVGLGFPVLAGQLVDAVLVGVREGIPRNWLENINLVALALIGVLALQAIFAFLRTLLFIDVGERTLADLRRDTFTRLICLPMNFHNARRVGELASRIATDLTRIRDTLVGSVPHFLREIVQLVGGVALILSTSLQLTGVMLISVPVLVLAAAGFGGVIRRVSKQAQDRLAESNVIVEETLQNIFSVKAYSNEWHEQNRYRLSLNEYLKAALRGAVYEGAFISFIVFALFGSIVLVLWYGARLVLEGHLSTGELTRFMLLTFYVAGAVGSFAELYSQIQRTVGASTRVREILRESPEELPSATISRSQTYVETPPSTPKHVVKGEIELRNIRFRYQSRPEIEVLSGVSLKIRPGERVALVGPSGAGKSTLISLLLRFYDPVSGEILIDNTVAKDYDLHLYRSQIAIVPQDVLLFGGTIGENIAYGRPGASTEEIEYAAREANAHEFISGFPKGYDTLVGERGVQLSGGQRQRIAIARAILRDPVILLLDEATSSLDAENERLVLEALDRLMQHRTALIIAHRLSTVRQADRIFVLKDGVIAESGTHEELLQRLDGVYRNLSLLQIELRNGQTQEATVCPNPLSPSA